MSRFTRAGLVLLVFGASIDLVYHGLILTILPLPATQETIVEYAGHLITFFGMIVMLIGVVAQARHRFPNAAPPAEPQHEPRSQSVSIRRR